MRQHDSFDLETQPGIGSEAHSADEPNRTKPVDPEIEQNEDDYWQDNEDYPQDRPVRISHWLLVIAGIAFAITLSSFWANEMKVSLPDFWISGSVTARRLHFAGYALSVLISASLTMLAMHLVRPRPSLKMLARQPGAIACASSTTVLICQTLALPLDLKTMGGITSPLLVAAFYWPTAASSVVLVSWLVLIISQGWRPSGDWIDRLGVLLGLCWIGLLPALIIFQFVIR